MNKGLFILLSAIVGFSASNAFARAGEGNGSAWEQQRAAKKNRKAKKNVGPFWGCTLKAKVLENNSKNFIIIRADRFEAYGTIKCKSATGVKSEARAFVRFEGTGIGINLTKDKPNEDLVISAAKFGVSAPEAMYGQYQVGIGPGLTLFAARIGLNLGAEETPGLEHAGNINVSFRELQGLGVDITAYKMLIQPVGTNLVEFPY